MQTQIQTKIVVFDDDPTGSQTVHSCLLLTRWDVATLTIGLQHRSPLFFVLTNTRGMDAVRAAEITREVCKNLGAALDALKQKGVTINPLLVSRSDSTLRGHYPVETDVMNDVLGPFDAHFMVPAFFEGGRFTRDSTHYIVLNGKATPVHETEFARDSVFGYQHSYLPAYVEEKTHGKIRAADVERFVLNDVRGDVMPRLLKLKNNTCCVVDSENQQDLNHFSEQLIRAAAQGKKFLFRSAASLLTALARLPVQPTSADAMRNYVRNARAGAVIVGSHVKKTTEQLGQLLLQENIAPLEVNVERLAGERQVMLAELQKNIQQLHEHNKTPVIFTTRVEKQFASQAERLAFGESVSEFLMEVVRNLPPTLGYLISKGGITSNDVLSTGLALKQSEVLGQILPGVSMVRCPDDHPRYPQMPVVIFPGNVGDEQALALVYRRLSESVKEKENVILRQAQDDRK